MEPGLARSGCAMNPRRLLALVRVPNDKRRKKARDLPSKGVVEVGCDWLGVVRQFARATLGAHALHGVVTHAYGGEVVRQAD